MTDLLALLIGGYSILSALLMLSQPNLLDAIFDGFEDSPALAFSIGVIAFFSGGLIVGTQNFWTDYKEVIVSIFGWSCLIEGALFMIMPTVMLAVTRPLAKTRWVVRTMAVITFLLGLLLVIPPLIVYL